MLLRRDILTPPEEAADELFKAADDCLQESKQQWEAVAAVCVCTSTIAPDAEQLSPQTAAALRAALVAKLPQHVLLTVHGSAVAVLSSGTGGQLTGAVLVAGS